MNENRVLSFSDHALRRARQRGVPLRIIEFIIDNADLRTRVGGACQGLMISRRKLARLSEAPPADRDRAEGVTVVVAGGTVVTVLHPQGERGRRYRRQLRTWAPRAFGRTA
jgi:hypothetical protein